MSAGKAMWIGAVVGVLACGIAFGQEVWKPVGQPDLKEKLDAAPRLDVEDVCVPVRTINRDTGANDGLWFVPNPDGKTWDPLMWYYPAYDLPHTLVAFDLGTFTAHVKPLAVPLRHSMQGGGRAAVAADGKLYVTTSTYPMGLDIAVYDPATNDIRHLGLSVKGMDGAAHYLRVGTDGRLYGSGSHTDSARAGAYQFDTKTGKITDYGHIGPSYAPNACRGYRVAAADEYVYISTGKTPWRVLAYNRKTGRGEVLLETEMAGGGAWVNQHRYGCTASARNLKGVKNPKEIGYWLYKGKAIEMKKGDGYSGGRRSRLKNSPPWPMPEKLEPERPSVYLRPPGIELFTDHLTPGPDGEAAL